MNRRLLVLMFVAALAVGGVRERVVHASDGNAETCHDECQACEKSCLACVDACLSELAEGKSDRKDCIKACLDCADICGICARIAARGGPMETIIAVACAQACEKCAAECQKHQDDKLCQACASQCQNCARACRAQVEKQ